MTNFWQSLKKPIYALAPMAGITDSPFRLLCREFGADVVYSEMASVAALQYKPDKTMAMLRFLPEERPYVVQLFGKHPEQFARAAKYLSEQFNVDGFDINFGCPVAKVQKQGAGAVLMGDPLLAREIVQAVIENTTLPVSIKIRARMEKGEGDIKKRIDALEFLTALDGLPIATVMIHGRSMAQGHSGPVDTSIIREARSLVKGILLANGGVTDIASAQTLLSETGADGLGIARGVLGRPWLFAELRSGKPNPITEAEIFNLALRQAEIMESYGGVAAIKEMRKHLCWYVSGLSNATELRRQLVQVTTVKEIESILQKEA
jgi:nifR3 family TIM-barrel protein